MYKRLYLLLIYYCDDLPCSILCPVFCSQDLHMICLHVHTFSSGCLEAEAEEEEETMGVTGRQPKDTTRRSRDVKRYSAAS